MRYVAQLLNLQRLSALTFGGSGNRALYEQLLVFRRDNYEELTAARARAKLVFCEYARQYQSQKGPLSDAGQTDADNR